MATNLVYRNTDSQNRKETLAATHGPGVAVLSLAGLPAVTVTGSGDYTITESDFYAPMTISGIPAGGVGLEGKEVTLAFDGTWEWAEGDVAGVSAATMTQGTAIYITAGLALTSTEGANTLFGYVDVPPDYDRTRGFVPVRVGKVA